MRGAEHLEMESGQSGQENTYMNMSALDVQKMKNKPKAKDIPALRSTPSRVIWTLGVLLILAVLTLVILTGLLFNYYKSLSGEQSDMKNNVFKLSSQLGAYKQERSSLSNIIQRILGAVGKLAEDIRKDNESELCGTGWTHYGLSCYYKSSISKTWNFAKEDCEDREAHLVVINGENEMSFLRGFSEADNLWIGLEEKDGTWAWVDGTSYESTPMFWQEDELNDWSGDGDGEGENCAWLVYGDHWDRYSCNASFEYICEQEIF